MEIRKMNSTFNPHTTIRCENCSKAYYDENYAGEPCRDCGMLLPMN